MTTTIETPGFLTFTISIVVFFIGSGLNRCIILPLVSAFFIDIINALVIGFFVRS